jgi:hypothetical protein
MSAGIDRRAFLAGASALAAGGAVAEARPRLHTAALPEVIDDLRRPVDPAPVRAFAPRPRLTAEEVERLTQ